jgi:major vault protein
MQRLQAVKSQQTLNDEIAAAKLLLEKNEKGQELSFLEQEQKIELEKLSQETKEIVERAGAVDDKLIAALQAFGDKALLEKTAEAMAPLAIFRNSGVMETLAGLLKGTALSDVLKRSTDK